MSDLSIFKIDSQTINIKDTTARQTADSAKTLATTASGNATTALNKINELESEKADKTLATTSANGLMSAADKAKLDGIGTGSNVKSVNGQTGTVVLGADDVGALPDTTAIPTKTSDLTNDSDFMSGMTILAYGKSTWADFIAAYTARHVVYCRASSGGNPASGSQTRMAFMAYVNDESSPTNVEFQYYRSISSHSATQQGDQVYVYKLDKTAGWTLTVRECYTRIVAGTGITATYSNGVLTIADQGAALNKINELEKLSRVSISYDSTKENMTITIGTHSVA